MKSKEEGMETLYEKWGFSDQSKEEGMEKEIVHPEDIFGVCPTCGEPAWQDDLLSMGQCSGCAWDKVKETVREEITEEEEMETYLEEAEASEESPDVCSNCGANLGIEEAFHSHLCPKCSILRWAEEMSECRIGKFPTDAYLEEVMRGVKKTGIEIVGPVKVLFQRPSGRSLWAQWVRDGDLDPKSVIWAFHEINGRRFWMAIYLDSGRGKGRFFDLQTQEGRQGLKQLEKEYASYLAKKRRGRK